jgi:hydrogenase expression/formation protein HypE
MKSGKLPNKILAELLKHLDIKDKRVKVGPKVGEDAAAIDIGKKYLLVKTDPITFTSDNLGWYLVNVNINDICTMGGDPKWLLVTLLFNPKTTQKQIEVIFKGISNACNKMNISLIGGHTEITPQVNAPIAVGCLLGEVSKNRLIKTSGAEVDDDILITKFIGLEGTSILANDIKSKNLKIDDQIINNAINFLFEPGISVLEESKIAINTIKITSMHDPTEGGLITGLEELALASNKGMTINYDKIPIKKETEIICKKLNLDPLGLISSGSLIITCNPKNTEKLINKISTSKINIAKIGTMKNKNNGLKIYKNGEIQKFPKFKRDEIARYFE